MKAVRGKKPVGAAVVVAALVAATVAFPARYYPAPVASKGGALSLCPSPAGLAPFSAATVKAATYAADAYPMVNETAAIALSDQAWWPEVRSEWGNNRVGPAGWTVTRSKQRRPTGRMALGCRACDHREDAAQEDAIEGARAADRGDAGAECP
jgi:hypothetical protein